MSLPSVTAGDAGYAPLPEELPANESVHTNSVAGPSVLERFVANFLNETNIKWLLVLGAAIVFASSLMLVGREFEHWPASLKYLTILGYTASIFCAAEVGRLRLGLKATSRVLHGLTLFLIPICFLSLHWASSSGILGSRMAVAEAIGLAIPAAAFAWFASARILTLMLREHQPTFHASYVLLSMFGALPVISHPMLALFAGAVLWGIMSVGTIKVNRHIFWLAEENRWPRIFAFFPSLLLGVLFLLTTGLRCVPRMSLEWVGFGCTLVAATMLLTARTVSQVFRQRTGDLVRPLPFSIVLPLFFGLSVLAAGVGLSFSHFPHTFALVPSCAVATILLMNAAQETRHRAFVWATLVMITVTWQFSPTLFRGLAMSVGRSVATALNQPRLPIAFYGLTYIPLIVGMSAFYRLAGWRDSGSLLRPLANYSLGLTVLLQIIALTHPVAAFIVSAVNVAVFPLIAWLQRRDQIAHLSLVSLLLCALTGIQFWNSVFVTHYGMIETIMLLAALGSVLAITRVTDVMVKWISANAAGLQSDDSAARLPANIGEVTGLMLAFIAGISWIVGVIHEEFAYLNNPVSLMHAVLPLVTFSIHVLRTRQLMASYAFWLLLLCGGTQMCLLLQVPALSIVNVLTTVMAVSSLAGSLYLRHTLGTAAFPRSPLMADTLELTKAPSRMAAFVIPFNTLSVASLAVGIAAFHLPTMGRLIFLHTAMPSLYAAVISVLWMVAAMFLLRNRLAAIVSGFVMPVLSTAVVASLAAGYSVSSTTAIMTMTVTSVAVFLALRISQTDCVRLCRECSKVWMLGLTIASMAYFTLEMRLVAVMVFGALSLTEFRSYSKSSRTFLAILFNLHAILVVPGILELPGLELLFEHGTRVGVQLHLQYLFFALLLSTSAFQCLERFLDRGLSATWIMFLHVGAFAILLMTTFQGYPAASGLVVMSLGFVIAAVSELAHAIRIQSERSVWMFFAVAGSAIFWMISNQVFVPGAGSVQLLMFLASAAILATSRYSQSRDSLKVIAEPFRKVGIVLPTIVAALALRKLCIDERELVRGLQALAVFGCAALYFHQWVLTRKKRFLLHSGAIVNLGFMCLWRTLQISDPQFYMVPVGFSIIGLVEILRLELPRSAHDPLRYIGALTILVSPVFQVLDGSWIHMLSLMALGVLIVLLSIGLHLKALLFTGTAFIAADLIAMSVRSSLDSPILLWLGGLALGLGVIGIAAFCENHRDRVLSRIRHLTAVLATWE
ncbi:MAG: hypothetical protein JNM43_03515 [Planctomycetaceae bacterium]|nr:hypothetical protein [Planctomycetaceae bacterium]